MKTHLLLLLVSVLAASGAGIVSGPVRPGISAAGNSFNPTFSADGRHLVFVSQANNLVANDDHGLALDVFVRDLITSNTMLVSVSASGTGGANDSANFPSVSSNGQFVAFASRADNLVAGDSNDVSDIFVRDLVAGTTRLVSVDATGIPFAGGSEFPLISADGRWVFFESRLAVPTNAASLNAVQVYARDLSSTATVLVSSDLAGGTNGEAHLAAITPDGRFVAFTSTATNMIDGQTNAGTAIYLRDMSSGALVWATTNCVACDNPVVDESGRVIAYFSKAVTATGQPVESDSASVLRHDRVTGETIHLGIATNLFSPIVMSRDGNVIAYNQQASGVPGSIVYVWNSVTGTNAVSGSTASALSADGNFLAVFANGQLFRINLTNGNVVQMVTRGFHDDTSAGVFELSAVALSPNGQFVAFDAEADDLVPSDFNAASDVFVRDMSVSLTALVTEEVVAAGTAPAHSTLGLNSISANGRYVITLRLDDATADGDKDTWPDVYVTDLWSNRVTAVTLDPPNAVSFAAPIISADGSTIYAVREPFPPFRARIAGAASVNGVFESTGFPSAISSFWGGDVNGATYAPSASADGQLLVFTTTATDLIEGLSDLNNPDVFLRERMVSTNGTVTLTNHVISRPLSGIMGTGSSSNGFLSPDARWVIFESTAQGLVPENVGGSPALYARDWRSNVTYLVSVAPNGNAQWGYLPGSAAISANSRYVAFSSGNHYLTVHDLLTHTSVIAADPSSRSPSLSHDGRYIAYVKRSDLPNNDQVYIRDLESAELGLASAAYGSGEGNGPSSNPLVSADGRYVVFQSRASNLVPSDTNTFTDIFVRDRVLGTTLLVSANAQALPGNGPSTRPVMAADGRTVIFQSFANDLVANDFNDRSDVFVLKLGGADTEPDGMDDDWEVTYFGNLSRNGTGDFDGDGSSDRNEFLAGTDPGNNASLLRVLTVSPAGGAATLVMWFGGPTRRYRVEYKDELAASAWLEVNGKVSWNGNVGSITDAAAPTMGHRFYRVVRIP